MQSSSLDYNQFIGLIKNCSLISLIGAGGKTTTMFKIADELKKLGKKVLVTTTTKILFPSQDNNCDTFVFDTSANSKLFIKVKNYTITCLGKKLDLKNKKIIGIEPEYINKIFTKKIFDCILVEADGAKRKSIKAPAEYEPIIPKESTAVLGMIGMDSIETVIEEKNVHRSVIFASITNSKQGEIINERIICKLILSEKGLFAKTPFSSEKFLFLNKAQHSNRIEQALEIMKEIKEKAPNINIIIN